MIFSTTGLIALVLLAGCGQSADSLVQQQVDQWHELADAMEAGAEQTEIDAIQQRMQVTTKAIRALNLSDGQEERLAKNYGGQIAMALPRVMQARMSKPDGAAEEMNRMIEGMRGNRPIGPRSLDDMRPLP